MNPASRIKRVKSGCATCRIRRIKCDERRPECNRCVSTGRKCDGYTTLPFSRRDLEAASQHLDQQERLNLELLPRLISDRTFGDVLEKRYHQFFRRRTLGDMVIDSRFWNRIVLQACHTEPAIKHAVLGLSSLHQLFCVTPGSDAARQHQLYAETQYTKALHAAQTLIASSNDQDLDCVLIACVLFTIFETMRGNREECDRHLNAGQQILRQNVARFSRSSRRKELADVLARLDVTRHVTTDINHPYPFRLREFFQTNPCIEPREFQDLAEAQAVLFDLVRWLMTICEELQDILARGTGDPARLPEYQDMVRQGMERLELWERYFEEYVASLPSSSSSPSPSLSSESTSPLITIISLRLWYTGILALAKVGIECTETDFDSVLPLFERVVSLGDELGELLQKSETENNGSSRSRSSQSRTFNLDIGHGATLFVVAIRCRDPVIRRRAIQLLKSRVWQEGGWESTAAAQIAEKWVEIEESGAAQPVRCAADIPNHRRIKFMNTVPVESSTELPKNEEEKKKKDPEHGLEGLDMGTSDLDQFTSRLNATSTIPLATIETSTIRKSMNQTTVISAHI